VTRHAIPHLSAGSRVPLVCENKRYSQISTSKLAPKNGRESWAILSPNPNLVPFDEQKNIKNLTAVGIASTDLSRHSPEGFTADARFAAHHLRILFCGIIMRPRPLDSGFTDFVCAPE
jgi:hypothetical protein